MLLELVLGLHCPDAEDWTLGTQMKLSRGRSGVGLEAQVNFSLLFSLRSFCVLALAMAAGCTAAGDPMEDPFMFEPPPGEDCPRSEHMCDGMCVPEQDNDPDQGCAEGCGDPCSAPEGATAAARSNAEPAAKELPASRTPADAPWMKPSRMMFRALPTT